MLPTYCSLHSPFLLLLYSSSSLIDYDTIDGRIQIRKKKTSRTYFFVKSHTDRE